MKSLIRAVVRFAIESMNVVMVPLDIVGFGSREIRERNKIH